MNIDPTEPFDWKKWDLAMKFGVMPTTRPAEIDKSDNVADQVDQAVTDLGETER